MEKLLERVASRKRRDIIRLLTITGINAGIAVVSFGQGTSSGNMALMAESSHETSDSVITAGRAGIEYSEKIQNTRSFRWFRRASYATISLFGAGVALKAGIDFIEELREPAWNSFVDNQGDVGVAFFNGAANQFGYEVAQKLEGDSDNIKDAKRHGKIDRDVSLALAGAVMVGSVVPFVAEAGGIAMGVHVAKEMWPTEHNMEHVH